MKWGEGEGDAGGAALALVAFVLALLGLVGSSPCLRCS